MKRHAFKLSISRRILGVMKGYLLLSGHFHPISARAPGGFIPSRFAPNLTFGQTPKSCHFAQITSGRIGCGGNSRRVKVFLAGIW